MKRLIALMIICIAVIQELDSMGNRIKGKVTDSETGEELTGATVIIKELNKGSFAGLDGSYLIKDIPKGTYILQCSFIGYTKSEQTIQVNDTSNITINFKLSLASKEIEQIIVSAQNIKSTEMGAKISEQKALQTINVVSARTIELSPDINMAGVLQRMSGITLDKSSSASGQYALLRGMDKRYNYTLVNGIKIPSTHNKHRYVSLELFPSDMVDRVEVTKALTPNMEADAIGGSVNLIMKNAPDKTYIQANIASGYNLFFLNHPFSTFNSNTLNPQSPYERNEKGYLAKPTDFNTKNLIIQEKSNPLNYLGNLTIGSRLFNKKLGWLFSGSFQKFHEVENSLYFSDDLSRDGQNLPVLKHMQERLYYEQKQNLGFHNKIDYQLQSHTRFQLYTAYIVLEKNQIREVQKTDLVVSYDPQNGNINRTHSTRLRFNTQSLFNITCQGDHAINEHLSMQWSAVFSQALNKTPEEATIIYGNSLTNFTLTHQYVDFDGSTRIWRRNSDIDYAGYLNIFYTLTEFNTTLQVGGMYRTKQRKSFYNKYVLKAIVNVVEPDTTYTSFYSEKGVHWNTYDQIQWQVYNPRGTVAVGENYDASEIVTAGYLMFKTELEKLNLTGGLRLENTYQGYYMQFPIGEPNPEGSQSYLEILPSIHFKYSPNPRNNIRLSYFKAINKPGFQEIVPYLDASEEPTTAGNKSLKHATAHNIDLRLEHFPDGLDQYMIGFFYKHIKNPIEFAFDKFMNVSQNIVFTPINTDKAINYGVEIDITKFFRQWGIRANYTRTQSSITTNKLSRINDSFGNDSTIFVPQMRPLYGQSANVANISFLYKGVKNGVNAQLAFTYTGDRIYTVSRFIDNDHWQKGFWQMDISAEKNFKNGIGIYMKGSNLLSTHTKVFIKKANPINNDVPYQNTSNTLVRDEYSKPSFLVGIKYKF